MNKTFQVIRNSVGLCRNLTSFYVKCSSLFNEKGRTVIVQSSGMHIVLSKVGNTEVIGPRLPPTYHLKIPRLELLRNFGIRL